jgi:cytochrome P450
MRTIGESASRGTRHSISCRNGGSTWPLLGRGSKEMLHFGFGHGPRVCPGKHLGQLEVALVAGAFVKLFRFRAVTPQCDVKAGVSTKPIDGTLVELELRG